MTDQSEPSPSQQYLSYLLRLWRRSSLGEEWQVSLENPRTGERRGFPNLNACFTFLQHQMEQMPLCEEPVPDTANTQKGGCQ